jgi:hypothetical protein
MSSPREHSAITIDSVVVATRDQVSSVLADEVILLSLQTAEYYGAQGVAARVWELVRDPIGVGELRDVIMSEYDVGTVECERDVLEFLRQLATEGLLEVLDAHPGD